MKSDTRTIVLTGCTRGLGRALVSEFVARGHTVWGCGRSEKAIVELRRAFPAPHDFSVVDVGDDAAVSAWAARLLKTGTVPDLVINNAALMNAVAPLWKIGAAEFDALTRVNINGVANAIRAFAPGMVARKSGVIVNLSSGWGRSVAADVAPYCATKYAIEGLSKAMAEEVPKGVAVVPLNPGVIDTDMLRSCWSDGAGGFPKAETWAKQAAPFILSLGSKDNGRSLTVPGAASD